MPRVFVGAGSNIDPERRLVQAARALKHEFPGVLFSSCYRNRALGFEGADFINAVAVFDTELDVAALLARLRRIEELCGRGRDDAKWAPRAMDLDLLIYGDVIAAGADYRVPRPDLLRRAYMLGPLAELAPTLSHPATGTSIDALWRAFAQDQHVLTRIDLDLNEFEPA
jgi:2-amino-4-hydroxy-6-hydroxymethyldihydropteridine diphosphokinase